jgi:hypothetical protein
VTIVEMIFSLQWRVGVRWSGEGDLLWWCRFNASFLAREKMRRDEALSEDETEAESSSWFNGKEV